MEPADTTTSVAPPDQTTHRPDAGTPASPPDAPGPADPASSLSASTSTSTAVTSGSPGSAAAVGRRAWVGGRRGVALGVVGLTAILALPLVVGLVAQWEPRWLPLTDMAHIELFVRDVGTSHTPQYGPIGRMYAFNDVGNHPGPLGFYALAPVYRLLGSDGWSLQAATVSVGLAAAAVAIWLGHRRGGWPFAVGVTAMLALLMWGYGAMILIEPWNPHLALGWWVVFLLAVWAVLCGDLVAVPVAALAGTFCMQNHIAYIPLVGLVGALAVVALVARVVRARHDRAERRRLLAWLGGGVGVLALLWLPVVLQQVDPPTGEAGNLSLIAEHLRNPEDLEYSIGEATNVWTGHLDPFDLLTSEVRKPMPWADTPLDLAGLGFVAAWLATAVLAWRRRDPVMVRLHVVAGIAAFVGWFALVRLTGPPWPYLFYWSWGTTALMLLAAAWTLLTLAVPTTRPTPTRVDRASTAAAPAAGAPDEPAATPGRAGAADSEPVAGGPTDEPARSGASSSPEDRRAGRWLPTHLRKGGQVPALRWARPSLVGLAVGAVLCVVLLAVDARDVEMDDEARSATLAEVAGPTLDRLGEDPAGCGDDCQVLVTWTDEVGVGTQALGLVATLEREGVDARMVPGMEEQVRRHRVLEEGAADMELHLAVAQSAIDDWRGRPGTELVATARPEDPTKAEPIAIFLEVPDRPPAPTAEPAPTPPPPAS